MESCEHLSYQFEKRISLLHKLIRLASPLPKIFLSSFLSVGSFKTSFIFHKNLFILKFFSSFPIFLLFRIFLLYICDRHSIRLMLDNQLQYRFIFFSSSFSLPIFCETTKAETISCTFIHKLGHE